MGKIKILIVEDDNDTLLFYKLFLGKLYNLETCKSDTAFYELINKNNFDLVIMDIGIKGQKNGLDLTADLRSMEKYEKVPIICLSAHVLPQDKKNAYSSGVNVFLEKPVENKLLLKTIKELTDSALK